MKTTSLVKSMQRYRVISAAALLCVLASATPAQQFSVGGASPLTVSLVLSPEFCSTTPRKGGFWSGKETFKVGQIACKALEDSMHTEFPKMEVVKVAPATGGKTPGILLIPKFIDIGATRTALAFSDRELVVIVEWTVRDADGNPITVQTVQGSAKGEMGNMFTAKGNREKITREAVDDLARKSSAKLSQAPELRALLAGPPAPTRTAPTQTGIRSPISITSDVTGADIEVDGMFSGTTPSTLRLSPGRYVVKVSRGSLVWQREVNVVAGSDQNLNAVLGTAPK